MAMGFIDRPAIVVTPLVTDLGIVELDAEHSLTLTVRNRGWSTIEIAGSQLVCGPQGCLTADGFPFRLAPGESRQVDFAYKAPSTPTFDYDGRFYTDAPGQREIIFHIVGQTDAKPRAAD